MIIVGATHGATAGYRADADVAYAEARKYTSNVVKVYSPNATWSKVKAAVVGASIVIYMGHGNGWPSPYTYDPLYTTKDGFGLNATAGAGDYNNKYYGEPYMASMDLAPGAIVLLHHLCYASGNSEPGDAEPSITTARKRADNYATGFLKAGASAVIADGHAGAERYLRALFTTHQSIEDMWRTMPNQNGNVVTFPSMRTPGVTVFQDPNTPTSGFYRSLAIGTIGVTTDEVISAGYGDTGANPTDLSVPGNAAVTTEGAGLYSGPDTLGRTGSDRSRRDPPPRRRSAQPGHRRGRPAGPGRGSRRPVDRRFHARHRPRAARQRGAVRPRARAGGPFSPNGDGQVDSTTIKRPLHRNRRLDAARAQRRRRRSCSRRPAPAPRSRPSGTAWSVAIRSRTAPTRSASAASTAGTTPPANATRTLRVDTDAPSLDGPDPRRRHRPVVLPERRRRPRHGRRQRDQLRARARSSAASSTPTAHSSRTCRSPTDRPRRR